MPLDIAGQRLRNLRLSASPLTKPADVVRWLGAVQAQEYADSKWALALRTRGTTNAAIERAVAAGTIVRTHVLRPTWHFVTAADIRWMLALTAPRVIARMSPYNRKLELDAAVFRRSRTAIVRALRDGAQLTRPELKAVLQRAGVLVDSVPRLAHIVMQAELDAVICSGARRGSQSTYALLDDRVPTSPKLSADEALAELTRRYFTSHGPAQPSDFAWWSGLTVTDARRGLALIERDLEREVVDNKTYWFARAQAPPDSRGTYLLGLYDEYLIAYKDRSAALDRAQWVKMVRDPFSAPIVVDGQVIGAWRRSVRGSTLAVTLTPFMPLDRKNTAAVARAAQGYAAFFGLDLDLSWRRQSGRLDRPA